MKVSVRFYANLKQYSPNSAGEFDCFLKSSSRVKDLLDKLHLPENVKFVILVNGKRADLNNQLEPNDNIIFFPPIEGG